MKSKKYIIFIYVCITAIYQLNAQVAINVASSGSILHIDPKGDTNGSTNTTDDVVILDNARLGIGTMNPSANLDIRGKMRIADGTEGEGKFLRSDDTGLASWGVKNLETIRGKVQDPLAGVVGGAWASAPKYVGANITLPKGSWIVYFQANYKSWQLRGGNIWWDLSSSQFTRNADGGRCLSNYAYPNAVCSTYAVYFVTLASTATYYMWGTASNLYMGEGMSYVGNGQIYAIQI